MTKMPSVLVETGFITNPDEEKYLISKDGQDYLASSIYRACKEYLDEIDSRSGISLKKTIDSIQVTDTSSKLNPPPNEIFFMVQLGSSLSKIEIRPENFKGLKDIFEIATQDRFKYAAGSFADFPSAVEYKKKIRTLYPDAFVIAVRDNKILLLQDALEQKRKSQNNIK